MNEQLPGRLVVIVVAIVILFSVAGAYDPNLPGYPHVWQGDDWINSQYVYLLILPFSLIAALAWVLDRRAAS